MKRFTADFYALKDGNVDHNAIGTLEELASLAQGRLMVITGVVEQDVDLVKAALFEVQRYHPEVTTVFYSASGNWHYCDDDNTGPFIWDSRIDVSLLETARDVAYDVYGFPVALSFENPAKKVTE